MDRLAPRRPPSPSKELTAKGVRVQFVKEQLTFTGDDSAMANLLLSVMGAFAELPRLTGARRRQGWRYVPGW
jgi:DNA invertase Pin-like site-specific DNA recombinase